MVERPVRSPRGSMSSLSMPELVWLWSILTLGLLLRVVALDWGLPPSTPEVAASGIRSSYAFDEDNVLDSLSRTDPAHFDIDPRLYHWGTLHLELVFAGLEAAESAGVFKQPWRESYRRMIPCEFEKVYMTGRLVSVLADLVTVFLVFLLGAEAAGRRAGLWAASLVSFAPGHLLQASQIRVDVTATTFVVLTVLLGVRLRQDSPSRRWFALGLSAGLAIAAKYSSVMLVGAVLTLALWRHRQQWTSARWMLAGVPAGFLIGEPFVITNAAGVARQVGRLVWLSGQIPADIVIPKPLLLAEHLADLARFSLGVPAVLLAAYGFWSLWQRRSPAFAFLAAALLGGVVGLLPQNWPLMRYHLPLVPLCAVGAAAGIVALPRRWGLPAGALALIFALCASLAQVRFMSYPHPANLAMAVIEKAAASGETVARLMPELPPLDPHRYPAGPNPFMDDLTKDPPAWVITSDLPIGTYPEENVRLLESRYEQIAVFRSRRVFAWATLGESDSPHDWKYTHPSMIVYHLR